MSALGWACRSPISSEDIPNTCRTAACHPSHNKQWPEKVLPPLHAALQLVGLLLARGAVTQYRNAYSNQALKVCTDSVAADWIQRVQVWQSWQTL